MLNWYDDAKPKKRKLIKVIYGVVAILFAPILYEIEYLLQSIFGFGEDWAGVIASITLFAMYFGGFAGFDKYANR